ncbi:MAG: hypothetical protein V1848_03960 [Candidatus Magasanikbacteria bacterium]
MQKKQVIFTFAILLATFCFGILGSVAFAVDGPPYLLINGGDVRTPGRKVTLTVATPKGMTAGMRLAHSLEEVKNATWRSYERTLEDWVLPGGVGMDKMVYIQFRNSAGTLSQIYSATIRVETPNYKDFDFKINNGATETGTRYVTLNLAYINGIEGVEISNTNKFDGEYEKPSEKMPWALSSKSGTKTVYVKVIDSDDKTRVVSKTINFSPKQTDIEEGTVLKGVNTGLYYLGYDGQLHSFFHPAIFPSWYEDYTEVMFVSDAKIREFQIGEPVCFRPGSFLLKFTYDESYYAVEPGCVLRPLASQVEASIMYGKNWKNRVVQMEGYTKSFYTIRTRSMHNTTANILDRDHDGVDSKLEKEYGSSDESVDSDSDGLTDYEEIYVWFSDPTLPDTDGDGYTDAGELLNGYSPVGPEKVVELPTGSVAYPKGSIVNKINSSGYTSSIQKHFIVYPPMQIPASVKKTITAKNSKIPMRLVGDKVTNL